MLVLFGINELMLYKAQTIPAANIPTLAARQGKPHPD